MYQIKKTGQFKKSVKLCAKRHYNLTLLKNAMLILQEKGELPPEYLPHPLKGKKYAKADIYDAHISPDWILLYSSFESDDIDFEGLIVFLDTGTHSDLF